MGLHIVALFMAVIQCLICSEELVRSYMMQLAGIVHSVLYTLFVSYCKSHIISGPFIPAIFACSLNR